MANVRADHSTDGEVRPRPGGEQYPDYELGDYGRAPAPLLTAFDYIVGQAEASVCCPLELAHGTVAVIEKFADSALRERFLPPVVSTDAATRLQVATEISGGSDVGSTRTVARTVIGGCSPARSGSPPT